MLFLITDMYHGQDRSGNKKGYGKKKQAPYCYFIAERPPVSLPDRPVEIGAQLKKKVFQFQKTVAQAVDDRDRNRYERKTADVL